MFLSKPGVTVIDTDKDIAFRYGFIMKDLRKQGTSIPANDIWIAACNVSKGAILLSGDKHFNKVPGLMVLDF